MEVVDKRAHLYELDEIYKYKDLIDSADRDIIKQIIYGADEQSTLLYNNFIKLVADEVDHQLNKTEFTALKDKLIVEMKQYLEDR